MKYTAVVHPAGENWNAYVPDLPGCVAAAPSRPEVERMIREAVPLHVETLRENGDAVPLPSTGVIVVDVA